jgi:PmbA protein
MRQNYEQLAKNVVLRARKRGAQQAEVYLQVGRQSSCRVRNGEIEDLTEATSKGLGLRVISQQRLGFAFTSDFAVGHLKDLVDRAIELASAAAPNRLNGLPSKADLGPSAEVGELFDPQVASLSPDWKIKAALEMERAGKAVDPRITAFDSVGAGDQVGEVVIASSEGFVGGFASTHVFMYAVPVASDGAQLQTGDWSDEKRFFSDLEPAESIGRKAAERAVRMLGAGKVKSQRVPVILDPTMAASFAATLASAANGDAVYKKSSFLADSLGRAIAPATVTLVDDGAWRRGFGTAPFDGEGVGTRRTAILEAGVVRNFLYDWFTARKAKARSTANAARSYSTLPMIGTHNLYLEAGGRAPDEIVAEVENGFYVTAMLGVGANIVTGEYSRGANGLWIKKGELTRPVQEVTVAGNMLQMLKDIDAVGNDLQFRGAIGAPTIRFRELTIAGE